jgi:hypothetical protein
MLLSVSTTAIAVTPDEVIKACDSALEARKEELRLCNLGIKIRTDENVRLEKENADLRDASGVWYKNPFLLIALGLVGGVVISR